MVEIITSSLAGKVLARIAQDPQMIGRLLDSLGTMPNIPTTTLGGAVFWEDIANVRGWRLQRNRVFGNYRLIDPQNIRRAWGGERAMLKAFQLLESL